QSNVTTYYNPTVLSLVETQVTVNTSFDGRTITKTTKSALDATGKYNVVTDTFVRNADATTTETRSGTGSFGAPAFSQTVNRVTNADASTTTTTLNSDAKWPACGADRCGRLRKRACQELCLRHKWKGNAGKSQCGGRRHSERFSPAIAVGNGH